MTIIILALVVIIVALCLILADTYRQFIDIDAKVSILWSDRKEFFDMWARMKEEDLNNEKV